MSKSKPKSKSKSDSKSKSKPKKDLVYSSKLTPEGDEEVPGSDKFDCCAFVIYCPKHQNMAVSKPDSANVTWLPFTKLSSSKPWTDGATSGVLKILSKGNKEQKNLLKQNPPFDAGQCLQVFRVQMPCTLKFVTRLVYYYQLVALNDQFACCQNTARIKWIPLNDVSQGNLDNLWGPELVEFSKWVHSPVFQEVVEYSLEEAFLYVPRDPPTSSEEAILRSAHISEKDVERLYADFIDHCYPSFSMTLESFKCYMEKYGFEKCDDRLMLLFNAFNYHSNGYLSFHELLLGLATIEPNTVHGEWRAKFIFRYYDLDNSGYIDLEEFRKMIKDINAGCPSNVIEARFQEALRFIGTRQLDGKLKIALDDFMNAVGSHRFRGTSLLCRSSKPIFAQISRTIAAKSIRSLTTKHKIGSIINHFRGECLTCMEKQYILATHTVKMSAEGSIVGESFLLKTQQANTPKEEMNAQRYSIEFVFNLQSAPNIMIRLIRQFNKIKGNCKAPKGLLQSNVTLLLQLVGTLCSDMEVLLNEETKCVKLNSPCFVFGDIHGNLEDLLSLEKSLWKRIPCVGSNYLFLGDYVDRGQWGLEITLYLFSFKILCPNNVVLLRGNHEVRSLQLNYTYKTECINKYGEANGTKIWEMTNKVFDKLPICAIVDDAVFCCHGGIPKAAQTIQEIQQLKREIQEPEEESPAAWEILWNDPCNDQQFIEQCNFMNIDYKATKGFLTNIKRGTGFLFNEYGAEAFLMANQLTHLVRAHEVPQPGYMFHFGSKCCTIFSCSHYCGNNNNCACILMANQAMRIITLDTVNNAPATD